MHKMSSTGQRFLAGWEGVVLHPYNDPVGNATIGVGHLIHYGQVTSADLQTFGHYRGPHGHRRPHAFDLEDAYTLLSDDLARFEHDLDAYIHAPLSQHQVDATLDLIYNCGAAPLADSFGAYLNARNYRAAADNMLNWCHAGGQILPGLQHRRAAERTLFLS